MLATITTAGLWVAIFAEPKRSIRFLVVGSSTVVGGAIYAAFEPACLAGPYGQLNPALKPIWLDHVLETKSLFYLASAKAPQRRSPPWRSSSPVPRPRSYSGTPGEMSTWAWRRVLRS